MAELLNRSNVIYRYIKYEKSDLITHMEVGPKQPLVEKHVEGLGFKLKKKGKPKCTIEVAEHKEEDERNLLCLAYYSMPFVSVFLPEGCLASVIGSLPNGPFHNINSVVNKTKKLYSVLKMEHFYDYENKIDNIRERLCFFVDEKILELNEDNTCVSIGKNDIAVTTFTFFKELNSAVIDTYLIVLLTIEYLCGKPTMLPMRKLIKELHASISELYSENVLPHIHSCLTELLKTSFRRFEQMDFVIMQSFTTRSRSTSSHLKSNNEKKDEIGSLVKFLQSTRNHSDKAYAAIEEEIIMVIQRCLGPLPAMAKL